MMLVRSSPYRYKSNLTQNSNKLSAKKNSKNSQSKFGDSLLAKKEEIWPRPDFLYIKENSLGIFIDSASLFSSDIIETRNHFNRAGVQFYQSKKPSLQSIYGFGYGGGTYQAFNSEDTFPMWFSGNGNLFFTAFNQKIKFSIELETTSIHFKNLISAGKGLEFITNYPLYGIFAVNYRSSLSGHATELIGSYAHIMTTLIGEEVSSISGQKLSLLWGINSSWFNLDFSIGASYAQYSIGQYSNSYSIEEDQIYLKISKRFR